MSTAKSRTTPYRICVVCTGNICRSPIGEVVLRSMLAKAGLDDQVEVDSAGTGGWHVGDGADHRALAVLGRGGYDGSTHRAREYDVAWLADHDLVLAADRGHLRTLRRWAAQAGYQVGPDGDVDIRLLREFDPDALARNELEVDDPYYGAAAGFDRTLAEIEAACRGLVAHLRQEALPNRC